jgi:hypothetical protein
MTIEESAKIDFAAIEPQSGEMRLIISDHLDWTTKVSISAFFKVS